MRSTSRPSSPAFQVVTCRTGPNTSRVRSSTRSSRITVGATKVPVSQAAGSGSWCSTLARCASIWALRLPCAAASMTGPMSVAMSPGSPRVSSAIAPCSISSTLSAISSCRQSSRRAEQRWPALWKAETITSLTTCSGRAVESTIMAFRPPVSAISGTSGRVSSSSRVRAILRAVPVEPVKTTPITRGSAVIAWPISGPPGSRASTPVGRPASCSSSVAA